MGIFNLFKKKEPIKFQTSLGTAQLIESKNNKGSWLIELAEWAYFLDGSATEPDAQQLEYLKSAPIQIEALSDKIDILFMESFNEAELPVNFKHWQERFELASVAVLSQNEKLNLEIAFQDKETPFYMFTTIVNNGNLSGFSIDS